MNLTEHAQRRAPVVFTLLALLMGLGAVNYLTLPAREDPEITVREAVVTTSYPGLSAGRMERLVTKTLEEHIRQVAEIEEIRSVSMPGRSVIHVVIKDRYFDLDPIWTEVQDQVEAARHELPEGTQPPRVDDEFGDVAVMTLALRAEGWSHGAQFDLAQHIRDQLYGVAGTKRIDLLGVQEERIWIEIANARLAELGVPPETLIATLRSRNIIRPGGVIDTGERGFLIQPTGNFRTPEDAGDTLIRLPGRDAVIPLRDVAEVKRGTIDPPVRKAYYNGEPAIILALSMREGYRVLEYSARLEARLETLAAELPVGYRLEPVTVQADAVAETVFGVSINVLQTLAIVLAVVVLFLGVRTGLIVGSIVPMVMLITLGVMGLFELSLQRASLATLIIALGLLVDNGVVIAEDFKRRLEDGANRDQALRQTGGELALPLLSSTLTTILVFLPLMLAQHVSGEYTRSVSLVILISLSISWLLAMTVTPLLCHRFLRAPEANGTTHPIRRPDPASWLFAVMAFGYERLLRGILRFRWLVLAVMIVGLGLALVAIDRAPSRFFPPSDRAQILVYLNLPAGVTSRTTEARLETVFEALDEPGRFPEITDYGAYLGFGGPRFFLSLTPIDPAPNRAFLVINVRDFASVDPVIRDLRGLFHDRFPGLFARVTSMYLGPSDSTKIDIQVKGPDADYLYAQAERVAGILRDVPGTHTIWQDWENRITSLQVRVDPARARRANLTHADIAESLQGYFSGRRISQFREGDELFPIVARAQYAERTDLDRLRTLAVYGEDGIAVPLLQVADVAFVNEFARIHREDLTRTVTVEARNRRMSAEDMAPLIQAELDALEAELAPGHWIELDGVVKDAREGQAALAATLPLVVGAILVLLVAQFNGWLRAAMIVTTIPLLLIGVAIGLHVMDADFGFMPLLGVYALAGILVNNAIVLIDRIDIERRGCDDAFEALIAASVRRLRPILMTTITTILGLLPLIVFHDALFFGMASVMAFGLGVGTLLTLGVVPVLYSLLQGIPPPRGLTTAAARS